MRRPVDLWLPALLALAACGAVLTACAAGPGPSEPDGPEPRTTAPTSSGAPASSPSGSPSGTHGEMTADLEVVVVRTPGEAEQRWTLRCSGTEPLPGSTHPDAAAACVLVAARPGLLAPPARGRLCTQQYGGPEVAEVTGTLDGRPVSRRFTRTDGCGIAEWTAAEPLLGAPGGAV